MKAIPDSKVHGANMGPIWGRQDPGGPHVGPMNLAAGDYISVWISFVSNSNVIVVIQEPIPGYAI